MSNLIQIFHKMSQKIHKIIRKHEKVKLKEEKEGNNSLATLKK